jgi:dTDP-4-dehydrorhamnose 3,5-epimerase-like enzyme
MWNKCQGNKNGLLINMEKEPIIIPGTSYQDERGILTFFNSLDLSLVKRFYIVEHRDNSVVRAWQGHKREQKWFVVVSGSFKIVLVEPDNWDTPSQILPTSEFILNSAITNVLHIPGGLANGIKALESDSKMIIFSNFTVGESSTDTFRFNKELWYNWNKI